MPLVTPTTQAPSLLRRSLWTIFLALIATALIVLILDFIQIKHNLNTEDAATPLLEHMAAAIEGLPDDDAMLVLRTSINQLNQQWQSGEGGSPSLIELYAQRASGLVLHDISSSRVLSSPSGEASMRATTLKTPHVTLTLYVPIISDGQLLQWLSGDVPSTLAVALPLLLIPTGWAVARGFRPINQLAKDVAQRRTDDLSAVTLNLRYRELDPIVDTINRLLERARSQVDEQRDFIADAAHELRTPLAVINARAHALAQADTREEREQRMQSLLAGTERAGHAVDQLLALARIDVDRTPHAATLLAPLAQQMLADLTPLADQAGVDLVLDLDRLSPHTRVDEACWRPIVENLLGNAIKYAGRGSTATVRFELEHDVLRLCVSDDGPGMTPEECTKALQRFHRGFQADRGPAVSGAGLGLSIVQKAVDRLRGEMSVSPARASSPAQSKGLQVRIQVPATR
ncbi:ATP-binding protein [Hydrogenophaga sp. 5NK40-0174]|uniref:sensor histidine kinase n=1 Tax=Hydrogenophaga sp. 5NK40-0174 TaxID=3127649 RepID=UPI00310669C3